MKAKTTTDFSKFNRSVERILSISSEELKRREEEWKKQRKVEKLKGTNEPKTNKTYGG